MIAGKAPLMSGHRNATARPIIVFTRSFAAQPALVRKTLISMAERLHAHVAPDLLGRAELVLAELLNNVTQHGCKHMPGPSPLIHLSVVAQPDGLACSVSDDGGLLPRACLSATLPNPQLQPEGGFGWFLIGHLTQSLVYFREADRNYVAFTVPLNPPKPD